MVAVMTRTAPALAMLASEAQWPHTWLDACTDAGASRGPVQQRTSPGQLAVETTSLTHGRAAGPLITQEFHETGH